MDRPVVSHPSLGLCAAMLAALAFVAALGITPVYVSHDRPPGAAVRFWWARLAPFSYSLDALRGAAGVIVVEQPSYCPDPESLARAWLTVAAHPRADSTFRTLFTSGGAATRIYALVGLAHSQSGALLDALAQSRGDTSSLRVIVLSSTSFVDTTAVVSTLATPERLQRWAATFERLGPPKCAA
jgi:hypothetical protein